MRVCWLRFVPWCHRLCKTRFLKSFRRRLVINHFRTCFKIRFSKFVKKYLQSFSCLFISNRRAYLKLFTFDMQVLLFLKSTLACWGKIKSSMLEKITSLTINSRILNIFIVWNWIRYLFCWNLRWWFFSKTFRNCLFFLIRSLSYIKFPIRIHRKYVWLIN